MRSRELIVSQIKSTRRIRHTTPIQCYIKHRLKNSKFSGYLVLILMLWGGFLSSAQAEWKSGYRSSSFEETDYIFSSKLACVAYECQRADEIRDTWTCFSYDENGYVLTNGDGNKFGYGDYCLPSTDNSDDCVLPERFNPATGLCDPNYTPPPPPLSPEKNLGSPPDCPSPYVASDTK